MTDLHPRPCIRLFVFLLIFLVPGVIFAADGDTDDVEKLAPCCDSLSESASAYRLPRKVFAAAEARSHYLQDADTVEARKSAARFLDQAAKGTVLEVEGPADVDLLPPFPFKAPKVREDFEGLDYETGGHQGVEFIPPDTIVAASETKVLEAVNVGMRLTDRDSGSAITQSLNNFFGEPNGAILFDPKVFFDRLSGRFVLVALSFELSPQTSFIYLSVSRSSDPDSLQAPDDWCNYKINSKKQGSFADYPGLGMNERWVAITTNNFRFNFNYRTAFLWTLDTPRLVDNADSCPNVRVFRNTLRRGAANEIAFTVQPAQHYSTTAEEGTPLYLVSSNVANLIDEIYTLWRIEDRGINRKPRLQTTLLRGSEVYAWPPQAEQRDGLDLDTGDTRIQQVAYRDGKIWAVHGTACQIGDGLTESCVRALEISPDAADGDSITFEETFGGGRDWFYWMPGVAINGRGDVAVAFQRSRDNQFLGVAFNGKRSNRARFDKARQLARANCDLRNFGGDINRSGDYVGLQADPLDDLGFWIAGEYAGPVGTNPNSCEWRTRVGRVRY